MRLTEADRDAFKRAIAQARGMSGSRIDEIFAEKGFVAAGERAAYWCQDTALKLKPWQWPPCWLKDADAVEAALAEPLPDQKGLRFAGELVRQLLALGLSRFEPDPVKAIARANGRGPPQAHAK